MLRRDPESAPRRVLFSRAGGHRSMAVSALDLEDLKRHIGRTVTATDVANPGPANLLRLAFGRQDPELKAGDALPPGWQILYFLPSYAPDELRPDGSARDAGVVPAMPFP